MRVETFILLAAAGAALAPSHPPRRRAVVMRALTADALETKRLQCFSDFDEAETRLAMRLIAAAESEEASLADSASDLFASSLARLRRCAFPDAVDAAWRDDELAAWNWTAPLVAACDEISRELQTVLAGDAVVQRVFNTALKCLQPLQPHRCDTERQSPFLPRPARPWHRRT